MRTHEPSLAFPPLSTCPFTAVLAPTPTLSAVLPSLVANTDVRPMGKRSAPAVNKSAMVKVDSVKGRRTRSAVLNQGIKLGIKQINSILFRSCPSAS